VLGWLAGGGIGIDEDELHGAVRRAVLLLAAGGDPQRELELDGRAVTALAAELDSPVRRASLTQWLAGLLAMAKGLPAVGAGLIRLLQDDELALRAYAAGLLGEELAAD